MLPQERHEIIIDTLNRENLVKVVNLVETFNVSIETIRRDLEYLENQGVLKRIYGGAVPSKISSREPDYSAREVVNLYEKQCIAKKTVELIENGETIILDLGTTTLEVAKELKRKENLTIITNSLKIALELSEQHSFRVYLAGGLVRSHELTCSGTLTGEFLKQFNVDKAIIGVGGITLESGITDYHIEETMIRKIMVGSGEKIIAVADNSKFATKALIKVCDIEDIDILVTDSKVHKTILDKIENRGINIVIAEV